MRFKIQLKGAIIEMRRVIVTENVSSTEFFVKSFAQLDKTRSCDCSFTE